MREKLMTLPLAELRKIAKEQGMRGIAGLRKSELVDQLAELAMRGTPGAAADEEPAAKAEEAPAPAKAAEAPRQAAPAEAAAPARMSEAAAPAAEDGRPAEQRQERRMVVHQGRGQQRGNQQPGRQQKPGMRTDRGARPERGGRPDRQLQERSPRGEEMRQERDAVQRPAETVKMDPNADPAAYELQRQTESQEQFAQSAARAAQGEASGALRGEEAAKAAPQGGGFETERTDLAELDSGIEAYGILEVMQDGFGFIRCENFLPGENDVYVAPSQIRRFNLKTGDMIRGNRKIKSAVEKFAALLYIISVNDVPVSEILKRPAFENLTPIFPDERIHLEQPKLQNTTAMRVMDLLSPIGKGQRGMIVSPPKAGKTTLLKQVARAVTTGYPDMHLIILLIDERPEEVTDIKEAITGPQVEVIYSTFDELPERHKRVSEMVIERAKRLVEHGKDVMILLDSITRLARAYNLVVPPSGRTLSGGLDPAALHMPKRFFGAARNMREGGSLTILATALIDTGSRMDDVVYEEFKGTGNMEIVLDRKLSEKRIFPAIDILKSGTRRDDLLLSRDEAEAADIIHKSTSSSKPEESVERILDLFAHTRNNAEFIALTKRRRGF